MPVLHTENRYAPKRRPAGILIIGMENSDRAMGYLKKPSLETGKNQMPRRVLSPEINHETNTFSILPTAIQSNKTRRYDRGIEQNVNFP